MRRSSFTCGALAVALVVASEQAGISQQGLPEAEKVLFDSVNRERAAKGLSVLKWDESLAHAARKHAEMMAEENVLVHQLPGEPSLATRAQAAGASFSHITENIGRAEDASQFHDGWMHSSGHRANILDEGIDSVGVAIVEGSKDLFAVEDFSLALDSMTFEEQEKRVGELLAAQGLRLLSVDKDVRGSCELDQDYMGKKKPRYIAHFESPHLSRLPDELEKELRSHQYKSAAVAACAQKDPTGPACFRIVVLLY